MQNLQITEPCESSQYMLISLLFFSVAKLIRLQREKVVPVSVSPLDLSLWWIKSHDLKTEKREAHHTSLKTFQETPHPKGSNCSKLCGLHVL